MVVISAPTPCPIPAPPGTPPHHPMTSPMPRPGSAERWAVWRRGDPSAAVSRLFNLGMHPVSANHYRHLRVQAFSEWSRAVAYKWMCPFPAPGGLTCQKRRRTCCERTAPDRDGERDKDQDRRDCKRNPHTGGNCLGTRGCDVGRRRS